MRTKHAALAFFLTSALCAWCFLATAPEALAACCKCHPQAQPGQNICIFVPDAACPNDIPIRYPKLSGMTCESDTYAEGDCKTIDQGGFCHQKAEAALYEPPSAEAQAAETARTRAAITPKIGSPIPGLTISPVVETQGKVTAPFMAQYFSAAYRYALGISLIAVALMLIYGGFLYIVGATAKSVTSGKEKIWNAIAGLIILLSAHTILSFVNPALVNPKPITLSAVMPIDYYEMLTQGLGFSDYNAPLPTMTDNPAGGPGGTAPKLPAPGDPLTLPGDNGATVQGASNADTQRLLTMDVPGEGSQKILAYCTSKEDAASLSSYEQKVPALVRAVLGFYRVCILENHCIYVRTGSTDLRSGKIYAGGSDTPFLLHNIQSIIGITPVPWDPKCDTEWQEIGGKGGFYKLYHPPHSDPSIDDFVWNNGSCYQQIKKIYNEKFVDVLSSRKILGGDCGSTLAQIYQCAGAKIGGGNNFQNIIAWGNLPNDDSMFIVRNAMSIEDFEKQLKDHGGPKFGDIVVAGNLSTNHNWMFTGGRPDVPFDIFEMGGGPGVDGQPNKTGSTRIPGLLITPSGMRVQGSGGDLAAGTQVLIDYTRNYMYKLSTKPRTPVSVIRPYQFTPCESRSECKDMQTCVCNALDGNKWGSNSCGMSNVCHRAKPAIYCNNDEQCGNPQICDTQKHVCKNPPQ